MGLYTILALVVKPLHVIAGEATRKPAIFVFLTMSSSRRRGSGLSNAKSRKVLETFF
jgi:hypothetical protein